VVSHRGSGMSDEETHSASLDAQSQMLIPVPPPPPVIDNPPVDNDTLRAKVRRLCIEASLAHPGALDAIGSQARAILAELPE